VISGLFKSRIQKLVEAAVSKKLAGIDDVINERIARAVTDRIFKPRLPAMVQDADAAFMAYSSCSAADMLHPRFRELCSLLSHPPNLHRKLWEWIFVLHHLLEAGVIESGRRGICFGVGSEALPAVFAARGATVMATDAPPHVESSHGWAASGQHASSHESLRRPHICPNQQFDEQVTYRFCDMNAIDSDLTGYDFAWSSCCFEHLGSLEAGMQFVINSVERCLKPGGIAVHTTELNLSSNEGTLDSGATVLYRRRDIIELIGRLEARGHDVQPFTQAPDSHVLDFYVDAPPYRHDLHLKLNLSGYVSTSVGIVVRRGGD
jgi:SAM-dependent methyltransferase